MPMTTRATTFASSALPRRGTARKVPVIVLCRYSEPTCMTPMVSSSRYPTPSPAV